MKWYDELVKNLNEFGYSLLAYPTGFMNGLNDSSDKDNQYYDLISKVINSVRSGKMTPCDKPKVIKGRSGTLPGVYLVESDHIHIEAYSNHNGSWYKLILD